MTFAVAFERPRPVGYEFYGFHNHGGIEQRFKSEQAGLAEPFFMRTRADKVETRR